MRDASRTSPVSNTGHRLGEGGWAVTGASGYVGGALADYLEKQGHAVHRLSRYPAKQQDISFELGRSLPTSTFRNRNVQILLHCAYDFSPRDWRSIHNQNISGSRLLFDQAREEGLRQIIFMSSLSAFHGCMSLYGQSKLAVEESARTQGIHVLRPGTIFGPQPRGLFGSILRQVRSRRVLPVIHHPGPLYWTYLEDLARLVEDLGMEKISAETRPWFAASSEGRSLRRVVKEIAHHERRVVLPLPIPWQTAWGILRALESLPVRWPFRSDSLRSLGNPVPQEEIEALAKPRFLFRPFDPTLL